MRRLVFQDNHVCRLDSLDQRTAARHGQPSDARWIVPTVRRSAAIGIDGLFFEVHPDPDNAPSDGPNMLRLDDFDGVLRRVIAIRQAVESFT